MSEYLKKYVKKEPPVGVKFRCAFRNTVYDVLKSRGWKETDTEIDWDIYWCDKEWIHDEFDHIHLQSHQKVNHFRNHYENLKRTRRQFEREAKWEEAQSLGKRLVKIPLLFKISVRISFAVYPETFVLPKEYSMFVEEFKKKHHNSTWIMKPVGKSQGRGIFLIDKLSQISDWRNNPKWRQEKEQASQQAETYVVQKYIENPLLVGGKKFDLRLYALVSSYSPLIVYIHRDGFARFSHTHFSMDDGHITNMCWSLHEPKIDKNSYGMHLTNVAIQKHSDKYDERSGGKWPLRNLKLYLISKYGSEEVNRLMGAIHNCILKSLFAVQRVMINDKHCFELYGYDILIDNTLRPWLLEVNSSPSLTANTRVDYEMKFGMLDDVLTIVDMEKLLSGNESQVGGFDLVYKGGSNFGGPPANAVYSTYIGCRNNRYQQMKKLAMNISIGNNSKSVANVPS